MLLSPAFSLCFCLKLIMNSDTLITVKCFQSLEVIDYWVKFENLCLVERQRDNGFCSQSDGASNCKLKEGFKLQMGASKDQTIWNSIVYLCFLYILPKKSRKICICLYVCLCVFCELLHTFY